MPILLSMPTPWALPVLLVIAFWLLLAAGLIAVAS
jgi:hypothetical protein